MTTPKPRLAVVGSGGIVGFHVAAAREAGFVVDHVAARPGSGSAQRFASEHSIGQVWEDPMDLIAASDGWDAILLATLTDRMPDLLRAACESGKPILAEKPTARHSSLLDEFDRHAEQIIVGYNRRFYSSVDYLRSFVNRGGPVTVQCQLPDSIGAEGTIEDRLAAVRLNSVHGFDLLRYVFGDITLGQFVTTKSDSPAATAVFTTQRGDSGVIVANWNAPANFSITADRDGERVDLRPFEIATRFEGMEVVEPTVETPIRRYLPKVVEHSQVPERDLKFKAGFVTQYEVFRRLLNGERDPRAAGITDARAALKIAEAFLQSVN